MIGSHMLQGNASEVHPPSDEDNKKSREAELDMAISPLAMPILAVIGTQMVIVGVHGAVHLSF